MESNQCIVDSSIFVAFYRDVDSQHADAIRVMQEISGSTLIVHPYVIQETATVLAYRASLKVAKEFLADVMSAANVVIPAVDVRYDMGRFMDVKKKISFTDVALIELAKMTGARVVTFDRQILSLAKATKA